MITSFFKTSKPIHYIIFSIVLLALVFYQRIFVSNFESSLPNYLKEVACLFVVIASFFVLIFIVTKNHLTQNNSFAALFFCLFIGVFPQILDYIPTLIANLFVLFSLRRIVSLKNKTNIKKNKSNRFFRVLCITITNQLVVSNPAWFQTTAPASEIRKQACLAASNETYLCYPQKQTLILL